MHEKQRFFGHFSILLMFDEEMRTYGNCKIEKSFFSAPTYRLFILVHE